MGTVGDDVVRFDLLGATCHIGGGCDGDPPEVGNLPEHGDFVCHVFAAAVGDEAEGGEDGHLVAKKKFLMHRGRDEGELLGGHERPELAAGDRPIVGRGVGQFFRIGHGLIHVVKKAPVAGLFGFVVALEDAVGEKFHEMVEPFGVVHHIEHEVLDAAKLTQNG